MANIVVVGQRAANQAYNPAIQQAQAQVPAINNLYSTLLQGLQNQSGSQLQNVLTSADQRGVMRASQPASTQEALNSSLMQAGAQLGAQQAQGIAGVRSIAGQGEAQRAVSAQQLVQGLTAADIAAQENKYKLQEITRSDEINTIKNQVQEAKANARAAAAAAEAAKGQELESFLSNHEASFIKLMGGDGKVSPETFGQAFQVWKSKGLPESAFLEKYKGYINNSHIQDYIAQIRK